MLLVCMLVAHFLRLFILNGHDPTIGNRDAEMESMVGEYPHDMIPNITSSIIRGNADWMQGWISEVMASTPIFALFLVASTGLSFCAMVVIYYCCLPFWFATILVYVVLILVAWAAEE